MSFNNEISDKLLEEILKIRKDGFLIDNKEHERDIICIAAPIRDYTGNVIAAISSTSIKYRMNLEKLISFKDLLIQECNNISKRLGLNKMI